MVTSILGVITLLKNTSWYLTIWASCQNIDTPIILVNRLWHWGDWKRIDIKRTSQSWNCEGCRKLPWPLAGRLPEWCVGYRVVCPTKLQFALVLLHVLDVWYFLGQNSQIESKCFSWLLLSCFGCQVSSSARLATPCFSTPTMFLA